MLNPTELLKDFKPETKGLTLAELLKLHPTLSRRTAQRWIKQLIAHGQLVSTGLGRARRYHLATHLINNDAFPSDIPLSTDSRDILAYVDKPLTERKPVGYQIDFLQSYLPNQIFYLS